MRLWSFLCAPPSVSIGFTRQYRWSVCSGLMGRSTPPKTETERSSLATHAPTVTTHLVPWYAAVRLRHLFDADDLGVVPDHDAFGIGVRPEHGTALVVRSADHAAVVATVGWGHGEEAVTSPKVWTKIEIWCNARACI